MTTSIHVADAEVAEHAKTISARSTLSLQRSLEKDFASFAIAALKSASAASACSACWRSAVFVMGARGQQGRPR